MTHQPSTLHPRRVLVLESDRLIEALIAEWLQIAGFERVFAHDALDAAAIEGPCDVVLADVPAPLKAAREGARPGIPVIAMSADILAHSKSATDALARELGAAAVLVKPFTSEALLDAISRTAP